MSTPLAGTVVRTVQPDAAGTMNQIVADATDTFAYVADKVTTGKVYQITIATGAVTGGSWPITGITKPSGIAISADGLTLYILADSGALYSSPISSPAATLLTPTLNNLDTFTIGWNGVLLDPANPSRLFAWNVSGRKVYQLDLNAQQGTYYAVPGGTHTVQGVGKTNDPNIFLVGLTTPAAYGSGDLLMRWYRKQHRWEMVAGTGASANGASGGTANLTAILNSFSSACRSWCTDTDGRVYFGRGTNTFSKVDNGILTDLNTGLIASIEGSTWFLPTLNQCLVCTHGGRVLVMS
jgi:hypothetical protein